MDPERYINLNGLNNIFCYIITGNCFISVVEGPATTGGGAGVVRRRRASRDGKWRRRRAGCAAPPLTLPASHPLPHPLPLHPLHPLHPLPLMYLEWHPRPHHVEPNGSRACLIRRRGIVMLVFVTVEGPLMPPGRWKDHISYNERCDDLWTLYFNESHVCRMKIIIFCFWILCNKQRGVLWGILTEVCVFYM